MSVEFQNLMGRISEAVKNRTGSFPPKKLREYEAGTYHPFFSLIVRNKKELMCMWSSDRRKDGDNPDVEVIRFSRPERGFKTDATDPRGWTQVTLGAMRALGLKL